MLQDGHQMYNKTIPIMNEICCFEEKLKEKSFEIET